MLVLIVSTGYNTPTPESLEIVCDTFVANLPRTVVQELEIGSRQSGFTRVGFVFRAFFLGAQACLPSVTVESY